MSANLDKSLGEIISSSKASTRGRSTRRRGAARAPVGGIAKNVAKPKTTTKPAAAAAAAAAAPSSKGARKIMVSGLPPDVTERDLQDYFGKSVGAVQKIELSYGPDGRSRGHATVFFRQPTAEKAVLEHNGLTIDKKHVMRIEVVYDARNMPPVAPAKSLTDRVMDNKKTGPRKEQAKKEQPKKVKADERGAASNKGGRGGAVKRGRNAGRRQKKTAEELDAEMVDYFDAKANGGATAAAAATTAPGAAAPAQAAGAEAMDEVL